MKASTSRGEHVIAMSCILGSDLEWAQTEARWTACTKGEIFHAAVWETDANDPDVSRHQQRLAQYKELTQALASGPAAGFAVAMDLAAFREVVQGVDEDAPYYLCLNYVVSSCGHVATELNAIDPELAMSIRVTVDRRIKSAAVAKKAYEMLFNEPQWKASAVLADELAFDDRSNPRIQMADLVAREAMKEMQRRLGLTSRPVRRSFQALEQSGRFKFRWHGRVWCQDFRDKLERAGASELMATYEKWLHKSGRVQDGKVHDTPMNRLDFGNTEDGRRAPRKPEGGPE
jgi:hypothetical protein